MKLAAVILALCVVAWASPALAQAALWQQVKSDSTLTTGSGYTTAKPKRVYQATIGTVSPINAMDVTRCKDVRILVLNSPLGMVANICDSMLCANTLPLVIVTLSTGDMVLTSTSAVFSIGGATDDVVQIICGVTE